jgi:hypothetical protein
MPPPYLQVKNIKTIICKDSLANSLYLINQYKNTFTQESFFQMQCMLARY